MSRDVAPCKWRWTTKLKLFLAGWRPRRNRLRQLRLPISMELFPAAERVLAEFGGLTFGSRTEHIALDPAWGEAFADEIKAYASLIGARLYPIGVMEHQDRHYILIDERGVVYTLIDQLEPLASSFHRAIEFLVRGTTDRKEIEEDLRSAGIEATIRRLDGLS
jgi:hypothetical protein